MRDLQVARHRHMQLAAMEMHDVELVVVPEHLLELHECGATGSSTTGSRNRSAWSQPGTRLAAVNESPLPNSVTPCPSSTNASVRNETTRSVPP